MKLPNGVYDVLKYVAQVGLPALATLWMTLGAVWGWDNSDQVVKTIVAVNVSLGALLLLNQIGYNRSDARFDGRFDVVVTPPGEDNEIVHMDIPDMSVNDLTAKGEVLMKVVPQKE